MGKHKHNVVLALAAGALLCGTVPCVGIPNTAWAIENGVGEVAENAVEVSTASELAAALLDNAASIRIAADIESTGNFVITHGVTIDGGGHTLTSTATDKNIFVVATAEPVAIQNITLETAYRAVALDDEAAKFTLADSTVTAKTRVISVMNGLTSEGSIDVVRSTLQIAPEMLDGQDYDVTAFSGGHGVAYDDARGISLYGVVGATVNIEDSTIQGFWTAININGGDATGTVVNVKGSTLKGRSGLNIYANDVEVNLTGSTVLGINNWAGPTEVFADVVINSGIIGVKLNAVDTMFTNYQSEEALPVETSKQYAVANRGYSVENPSVISFYGTTSFVDTTKASGKIHQVFEPSCNYGEELGSLSCPVLDITGGTYDYYEDIATYFMAFGEDEYDIYALSDDGPYAVDRRAELELPEEIYLVTGEEYALDEVLGEVASKYASVAIDDRDVIDLNDGVVTAKSAGTALLNVNLHSMTREAEATVAVIVYRAEVPEDEEISDADTAVLEDWANEQISDLIASGDDANEYVALDGVAEIDGVRYEGVELVKQVLKSGQQIHAVLTTDDNASEDEWKYSEAYDEIMESLGEGEVIAAFYDGYVELLADDGTYLGTVYELDEPVTMRLKVPETLLDVLNGVERKFVVVRGHLSMDGVESAERIEAELVDGWLVFRNRLFSSFAIAYADTTVSAPSTGRFTSGIAESRTKGDYTALLNTVGAMLAMITVFGSFRLYRKIQRKIYRGK